MFLRLLADLVLAAHFAFIAFALAGGVLVLRWRRCLALHVPAALWAVLVEFAGWPCPLTPLENRLREAAGQAGYDRGFLEHYLAPAVYPAWLTREAQLALGAIVLLVNLGVYAWVWHRAKQGAVG